MRLYSTSRTLTGRAVSAVKTLVNTFSVRGVVQLDLRSSAIRVALAVLLLVATILAMVQHSLASDSHKLISQDVTDRCLHTMGKEVNGLLAFRFLDAEAETLMTSVEVYRGDVRTRGRRPLQSWQGMWYRPGFHQFDIVCEGYKALIIDSIRVPPDSLTVVTVMMQPGTDTILSAQAWDCCIHTSYDDLDDLFPRNMVVGKVIDDSSNVPVEGVEVYCEGVRSKVTTDSLGEFALPLGTLNTVTLHVWHPLYDSIRFEVGKEYIRTEKPLEIHFEQRRDAPVSARPTFTDSTALLIVGWMSWSSKGFRPREFEEKIYTYAVAPGEVFGPTSHWVYGDCLPFRLVRTFPNREAWVQFARGLGPVGEKFDSRTNFLTVSDTASNLSTHSLDAGSYVTLQLQPDYSPRGTLVQKWQRLSGKPYRVVQQAPSENDSCDMVRAEVERINIQNLFYLLEGDFASLVKAFSADFYATPDPFEPSVAYFERILPPEKLVKFSSKRLMEHFDLRRAEIYVHGQCDEPVNEKYRAIMIRNKHEPQEGDVFIFWPGARNSPWHDGWTLVFRKENGQWKIITAS